MARYDAQGGRIVTNVFEAAAWHYNIKARCSRCGHTSVLNRYAVWWRFERRDWDMRLRYAARRFRCLRCGTAAAKLEPVRIDPTTQHLPVPSEADWKRAVNRFRS
jgi:hypothetical protein